MGGLLLSFENRHPVPDTESREFMGLRVKPAMAHKVFRDFKLRQ